MSAAATAALYEPFVCLWQMHEVYYLHVGTGKQAKHNPQELVQQVDESMRALHGLCFALTRACSFALTQRLIVCPRRSLICHHLLHHHQTAIPVWLQQP